MKARGSSNNSLVVVGSNARDATGLDAAGSSSSHETQQGASRDLAAFDPLHRQHSWGAQGGVGAWHRHVGPPRHALRQLRRVAGFVGEVKLILELPAAEGAYQAAIKWQLCTQQR